MRIKRIFTMALATAVLVQSLGTSAYAAGANTVPEETVVETVAQETESLEEGSEELTTETVSVEESTEEQETPVTESEVGSEEASEAEAETVAETTTEEVSESVTEMEETLSEETAGTTEEKMVVYNAAESRTYTDEDFPDKVFRELLKKRIGSSTLTSENLEEITFLDLNIDSVNVQQVISSLEGIQYLPNLKSIQCSGQSISDASLLSTLTKLEFVQMSGNDLTEMPDLSALEALESVYFYWNRMDPASITEDKLPEGFLEANTDWIADCKKYQNVEFSYQLAEKYYGSGDAHPFFIEAVGYKNDMSYVLSLEIDGKTVSAVSEDVSNSFVGTADELKPASEIFIIPDITKNEDGTESGITITPGAVKATLIVEDEYGREYVKEEVTLPMEEDIPVPREEYYLDASTTAVTPWLFMGNHEQEEFQKLELIDAEGKVVGSSISSFNSYSNGNTDSRYEQAYKNTKLGSNNFVSILEEVIFFKFLSAGDYDLKLTMTDGTIHIVEDVIHVSSQPVITSYGQDYSYDNSGDYIYLYVTGSNLDSSKFYPVISYEGTAITGEVAGITLADSYKYDNTIVYKLKKIKNAVEWENAYFGNCTVAFKGVEGYSVKDASGVDEISINARENLILYEHYNHKKSVYEVFLDSSIPEGTEFTVSICDSSYTTTEATASATVSNQMLSLSFVDTEGNAYTPRQYASLYWKYEYELNGEAKTDEHWAEVKWWNYNGHESINTNRYTERHYTFPYQRALLKELEVDVCFPTTWPRIDKTQNMDVEIYTSEWVKVGSSVSIPCTETTIDGKAYIRYAGTWTDATGLEAGTYWVKYMQNGSHMGTGIIYVYDNSKFYMDSQDMQRELNDVISVSWESKQVLGELYHLYGEDVTETEALEWWNANCKLSVYDGSGNAVTGWTVTSAAQYEKGFTIYVSGLSKEYTGFYFKVMDKNGNPGIRWYDGSIYYEDRFDSTVELGQWEAVFEEKITWEVDERYAHGCNGIRVSSLAAYPVKAIISRPYDTEVIREFTINGDKLVYQFTESDLNGIKADEIYRMEVFGANGVASRQTGYFMATEEETTGETVDVTGITLDKTSLNMQLEETEQLSATVKPANATNTTVTWSSSDRAVATVSTSGKVTAVGIGTATITASTHNGKTAKCTVNVYSYSISNEELHFDLSSENFTATLSISNGVANVTGVTWSSQDSSVASVDKKGKVTATGIGTTVIEGAVKDGPTLTCKVTVERNTLEKIALSAESMELDKGMSQRLTVYFVPNDVTCDKTIIWTTSDKAVASVDENGRVTANAKGTAVITATVKNTEITAQCTVKVYETVDEDLLVVPTGLTALTNVDKKLGDVSLDAFDGWKWENPEIELGKFSGEQEKAFIACYQKDEDTRPVYKAVNVKLSTVTGISVKAENASVLTGESARVNLIWNLTGNAYDMSEYEDAITWKNSKTAVATVSGNGTSVSVNAVAKGKTAIETSIVIGDKTYKAKTSINVMEGKRAQIQVTAVSGMTETTEGSGIYTGNKKAISTGTITAALSNAEKLTVKSNNAKVIAVKNAVVNEDGTFSIPYEVKTAGTAKILLSANDALKTCKEVVLQVKDVEPSVSATAVKVNRLLKSGISFDVYPGPDAAIKFVELTGEGKDFFTVTYDKTTKKCSIATVDEKTPTGKYTAMNLQVTFEDESIEAWSTPFVVTVEEKKPSFKVKQSKKVNLFMDKALEMVKLNVTASDDVVTMKLANVNDANFGFEIREVNGEYFVAAKANGLTTKANKKGTITCTFENYRGEYSSNFTVGLERKAPKLTVSSKSSVLYPAIGINEAKVNLLLNKEVYTVDAGNLSLEGTTDYQINIIGNEIILTRTNENQTGKVNAKLVVTNDNWAEAVKVPVTLTVNKKTPKVKLSKASVQLNTDAAFKVYDAASVQVMWKDGAVFTPDKITISAVNATSQKVLNKGILFDVNKDIVTVKLNNTEVAKGSYKFKVNVKTENGYTASEVLTVKVVPMETAKEVKVSVKGNIDVLNRNGSYVTVTPALKGVNGTVVKAELTGGFKHLFEEPVIENGKLLIYAKEDVNLITKYDYKVKLTLTLENALGETMEIATSNLKLSCRQGKAKIAATPKKSVFYSNAYNSTNIDLAATLKGAADPKITDAELLNNTNAFDYSYDASNQKITVTMKNNGEAVKGKSYNLQFKVTLAGQADNEKATVIKYNVTVK
ncbi:MAG: Ig-like domain-containing protein [Acetatifactor sp.]